MTEIILRLRSSLGQNRLTVTPTKETFLNLKEKLSNIIKYKATDFTIHIEDQRKPYISVPDSTLLSKVPGMVDGSIIFLKEKQGIKFEHQIVQQPQKKQEEEKKSSDVKMEVEEPVKKKCLHGPEGKCLNCMETEKKTEHSHLDKKAQDKKWQCQHGPGGKCMHCMDDQFVGDIKHVSFDDFLDQKKLKCKGVHLPETRCVNCTPPQNQSYKQVTNCKNHGPKDMCNKCLPQNVTLLQQEYRHIDYSEFMNFQEVNNFVNDWKKDDYSVQRMGFLFGYYAVDPNYKGGVRAIIEAIYYPPQKGDMTGFMIEQDNYEQYVNLVASALDLEKIGWIFTTINHDCFMTSNEIRMAARFQEEHRAKHQSGYEVSKFITIVLRTGKQQAHEVQPEVYMVSDQCQALERDNIFGNPNNRKMMNVREPKDEKDYLPKILKAGKEVQEFEPDFFIVSIANGHRPNSNFSIVKHTEFPVENRSKQSKDEVKKFLQKFRSEKSFKRYSDFHLLIYLSKVVDIDTVISICTSVSEEKDVNELTEEVVRMSIGN